MPISGCLSRKVSTAPQGGQKVGVAGSPGGVEVEAVGTRIPEAFSDVDHVADGELDGLLLGCAGFVDLHLRQQLGPVAARAVGRGIAAEVGLGAVVHRHCDALLRLFHELLLEGHDGLHGLVGVVDVKELDRIVGEHLLAGVERIDAAAKLRRAAAVLGEHHLVADVDAGEARRRGEDVEQMIELVLRQRRHLAPGHGGLGALFELGLDLGAGHLGKRPVSHARRQSLRHTTTPRSGCPAPIISGAAAASGVAPAPRPARDAKRQAELLTAADGYFPL